MDSVASPKSAEASLKSDEHDALVKSLMPVLIVATAIGPLAMSSFVPTIPAIKNAFGVDTATANLTLSLSMVGMAFATLAYGPLSDRFGRRPVLIGGVALGLVGSALGVLAPTIETVIVARILQAAGATSGIVLARVIVQDVFGSRKAAAKLGAIASAMIVAPMIGPTIGALFADHVSWRANFAMIALAAAILLFVLTARLPETRKGAPDPSGPLRILKGFGALLATPGFVRFGLFGSFAQGAFFVFMAGAPFVVTEVMDAPARVYGVWFTTLPIGFFVGARLTSRFGERLGDMNLVRIGAAVSFFAAAAGLGLGLLGVWTPAAFFIPAAVLALGNGLSIPGAQAGAVTSAGARAGSGSSLFGFMQSVIGAALAQTVSFFQTAASPYPTIVMIVGAAAIALALAFAGARPRAAQ